MRHAGRLRLLGTLLVVQLACGGGDGPTGPTISTVQGYWKVVEIKQISRADASVFEVTCCPGATLIEFYESDGSWSSTYDDGVNPVQTITGQVSISGDSIYFTITGDTTVYNASLQISQGTMTQRHPTTHDFDGDSTKEPAVEETRYTKTTAPPPPPPPPVLTYPPLNGSVNTQYCVQGNTTTGDTKSGSIAATDCDYSVVFGAGQGYFEIWRVRVATARSVTFTVDAPGFDSYIDVAEFTVSGGDVANYSILGSDDDTNGDDPVLTLDLLPNTDYAVVVSGFDYPEVGAYTLNIQ